MKSQSRAAGGGRRQSSQSRRGVVMVVKETDAGFRWDPRTAWKSAGLKGKASELQWTKRQSQGVLGSQKAGRWIVGQKQWWGNYCWGDSDGTRKPEWQRELSRDKAGAQLPYGTRSYASFITGCWWRKTIPHEIRAPSNRLHNLISACIPALSESDNVSVSIISFACCLGTTDPHMWPTIFSWEYASEEGPCGTMAYLQALANEWWKTGTITATNLLQCSWPGYRCQGICHK